MPDLRAYVACLHCRQRKSKCVTDPSSQALSAAARRCQRCIREDRECVRLNTRRKSRHSVEPSNSREHDRPSVLHLDENYKPETLLERGNQPPSSPQAVRSVRYFSETPYVDQYSVNPVPEAINEPLDRQTWQSGWQPSNEIPTSASSQARTDDVVASGRLQNPGDALHFLARVANGESDPSHSPASGSRRDHANRSGQSDKTTVSLFGEVQIPFQTAELLLTRYRTCYHAFFPIVNDKVLDCSNIESSAVREPHLLLVLLTIASKQDVAHSTTHTACLRCLDLCLAKLMYFASQEVEAVEALLLLAEWIPQKLDLNVNIGCGEEDRASWMQVGLAVRLGYLQGLDTCSFVPNDAMELQISKRRRVVWAACFMSDRQISVRIGKGFWSRGPGPSSSRAFDDYEPFQPGPPHFDNYSSIFQAHLDLTQLFSNAHDVLYASSPQRDRLFRSGEYAKYIDDFLNALANWHDEWGSITCSPGIKSSLILSYEYLRLYVTAFAYQATLSRLKSQRSSAAGTTPSPKHYIIKQLASIPDARFIYESINAAKTLLSTFTCFVDPVTCLKYMPVKYYLYVIYAAVFLYKVKATGILDNTDVKGLNEMMRQTISRLQQSSVSSGDIGSRYSNLLSLLWRIPRRCRSPPKTNHNSKVLTDTAYNRPSTFSTSFMADHALPYYSGSDNLLDPMIVTTSMVEPSDFQPGCGADFDSLFFQDIAWNDLEAVGHFATKADSAYNDRHVSHAAHFGNNDVASLSLMEENQIR